MPEINEKEIKRRLEAISGLKPSSEATARDLERVRQVLSEPLSEQKTRPLNIGRKIMGNRIVQFSVSTAILVAILVGVYSFTGPGPSVAFADVIKPILEAKTAVLDLIIGPEGQQTTFHDEIMGSRIRRTVAAMPDNDTIIDLKQMKLLSLDHKEKEAVYVELEGLGSIPNYLEHLKSLVTKLRDCEKLKVEDQGLQKIDGRERLVFVIKIDDETITILVDPETSLPVCIKQKTPNMLIVADNLQFDVPLDESRFSMEAPDGYKVHDAGKIDFKKSSENDFIKSLRIWAKIIEKGYFPDSINLGNAAKIGLKFDKALKREKFTDQQKMDTAMQFGQGLVFIRFFKGQGEWHYAGKGVELGDGTKPVFWYQPKKSETWRVIYGDLTVKDVAKEDLPQSAKSDTDKP